MYLTVTPPSRPKSTEMELIKHRDNYISGSLVNLQLKFLIFAFKICRVDSYSKSRQFYMHYKVFDIEYDQVKGLLGRSFCTDVLIIIGNQNCPLLPEYDGTTDQLLCTLPNMIQGSYSVNVNNHNSSNLFRTRVLLLCCCVAVLLCCCCCCCVVLLCCCCCVAVLCCNSCVAVVVTANF